MKVLVADDSIDLADVLNMHLSANGFEVLMVYNGLEVLDHPKLPSIDLIVMDVQMPVMDGLTAAKKLRDRGIKIPIIACTGMQDAFIEERIKVAGCSSYIQKPIDFDNLLGLLRRLKLKTDLK
jgi:CheY-like chemotaxis protein